MKEIFDKKFALAFILIPMLCSCVKFQYDWGDVVPEFSDVTVSVTSSTGSYPTVKFTSSISWPGEKNSGNIYGRLHFCVLDSIGGVVDKIELARGTIYERSYSASLSNKLKYNTTYHVCLRLEGSMAWNMFQSEFTVFNTGSKK